MCVAVEQLLRHLLTEDTPRALQHRIVTCHQWRRFPPRHRCRHLLSRQLPDRLQPLPIPAPASTHLSNQQTNARVPLVLRTKAALSHAQNHTGLPHYAVLKRSTVPRSRYGSEPATSSVPTPLLDHTNRQRASQSQRPTDTELNATHLQIASHPPTHQGSQTHGRTDTQRDDLMGG